MRHRKHNHLLGVKTAHRTSLLANLSCSLIENGRIKTTLAKAKALRPAVEKAITLAKKSHATEDSSKKVHYRRQAIARLRSKTAVKKLFDELVDQFESRNGGYTRIYKLAIPRLGDAADMAIIEFVEQIQKKKPKKKAGKKPSKAKLQSEQNKKEESSDASTDSSTNEGSDTEDSLTKQEEPPKKPKESKDLSSEPDSDAKDDQESDNSKDKAKKTE